jgi:hypothetical protein
LTQAKNRFSSDDDFNQPASGCERPGRRKFRANASNWIGASAARQRRDAKLEIGK